MQRDDDYMMRQVPSYRDNLNPAMPSTPEMHSYYDDPVSTSPLLKRGIYI